MPSYGLLVISSLGIMGCGVAAGMYQAKHNTEGTEDWRKLPPSQQVKHWKLYVFFYKEGGRGVETRKGRGKGGK